MTTASIPQFHDHLHPIVGRGIFGTETEIDWARQVALLSEGFCPACATPLVRVEHAAVCPRTDIRYQLRRATADEAPFSTDGMVIESESGWCRRRGIDTLLWDHGAEAWDPWT